MVSSKLAVAQRHRRRAKRANLIYVNDFNIGIRRRPCGRGFRYFGGTGSPVRSQRVRERIESLAIPPAWQDVWICARPNGHIQAIGYDDAGLSRQKPQAAGD